MTTNKWIGDAVVLRQIDRIVILATFAGASCRIVMNGKACRYTVPASSAGDKSAIAAGIAAAVTALIEDNVSLSGRTVSTAIDDQGSVIGVDLYGPTDGTPTVLDVSGAVSTTVEEKVKGRAGKNCKHLIVLPGTVTAGNFTLTYRGTTTGNIAYNASAATVQTDLTGLASIGAGNVSVSGSNGGPYTVEWIGDFAGRNPEDIFAPTLASERTGEFTANGSGLTSTAYGAAWRVIQAGGGRKNCRQVYRIVGVATSGSYYLTYGSSRTGAIAYNATAATVQANLQGLTSIGGNNAVVTGDYLTSFMVEFVGELAGTRCGRLVADRSQSVGVLGDGQFEVTRVDTTASVAGPNGTIVQNAAIKLVPTRSSGLAVTIDVKIVDPITSEQHVVSFSDGDSASEIQSRINAAVGSYKVFVSIIDDGYRFDMIGTWGAYVWTADDFETGSGLLTCIRGGVTTLLQNHESASETYWIVRYRSANPSTIGSKVITLSGPCDDGTTDTITFNTDDTVATINTACAACTPVAMSLVCSEDLTSVMSEQRSLIFTFQRRSNTLLSAPSPAQDISLSCAGTALSMESIVVQQGEAGTNAIHELTYQGYPYAGTTDVKVVSDLAATLTVGSEASDLNWAIGETGVREVFRDPTTNSVWLEWYGDRYRGLATEIGEVTGNSLSGTNVLSSRIQSAQASVSAEHLITVINASGGTFTLTLEGQTTSAIAWNAEAGIIQSALEALSNVAPGDVAVYGKSGGPWRIVYLSSFSGGPDVTLITLTSSMTADAIGFIGEVSVQAATGPADFMNVDNWSLGIAPATGQTLLFTNSNRSCKYNINQPTIVPSAVYFDASYIGEIGLPDFLDDAAVVLDKELSLGTTGAGTMTIHVGRGDGPGSPRIRFNSGDKKSLVIVRKTGDSSEDPAAFQWRGTHANNVVEVYRGNVGIALAGESATVETLRIGYVSAIDSDAIVQVGDGVTLSDVDKSGGEAWINCAVTNVVHSAGTLTLEGSGAVSSIIASGGTVSYNTSGTLTNASLSNGAQLNFDGDLRDKTVSNPINVYGDDADVSDVFQVVASLAINYNRTTRNPNLGTNYRLTRAAL